nr:hypothetical protein [Mycobacterium sp. E787]
MGVIVRALEVGLVHVLVRVLGSVVMGMRVLVPEMVVLVGGVRV